MCDLKAGEIRKAGRAMGLAGENLTNYVNKALTDETMRAHARLAVRVLGITSPAPLTDRLKTGIVERDPIRTGINPFTHVTARDWLAAAMWGKSPPMFPSFCLLIGDGPFEATELARFLQRHEIGSSVNGIHYGEDGKEPTPTRPWWRISFDNAPPIAVVGEQNAMTSELRCLLADITCKETSIVPSTLPGAFWLERCEIDPGAVLMTRSRSLANMQFISQQMLLAALFSGGLDFTGPWPAHAAGHPVLSQLPAIKADLNEKLRGKEVFLWPSTDVTGSSGSGTPGSKDEWPQIGLLKHLGYAVGVSGKSEPDRRHVLNRAFELVELPRVESATYVASWGKARSAVRLRKMAESIAAFCRNAKLRDAGAMATAIAEWEADLAWLKRTYYDGRFDRTFPWPATDCD